MEKNKSEKITKKKILIEFDEDEDNIDQNQIKDNLEQNIEKNSEINEKEEISIINEEEEVQPKKKIKISICFPDSIVALHQSSELRSYFISEIARMATIFCVDEIVILKDHTYKTKSPNFDATQYLAINLQYLESPQYLRKALFPIHPDLRNAGLMNPIESKHHLKSDEFFEYREGYVLNRPVKENASGSWVDIGLKKYAKIDYKLQPMTRVTVKLNEKSLLIEQKNFSGKVVPQSEPKDLLNTHWGYSVRIANSIKDVFKYCPFGGNYDLKLYVGNDGINTKEIKFSDSQLFENTEKILVVFGGFEGLEAVLEGEELSKLKTNKLFEKFNDCYSFNINKFGVKNLRLEEEMFMFLNLLTDKFN